MHLFKMTLDGEQAAITWLECSICCSRQRAHVCTLSCRGIISSYRHCVFLARYSSWQLTSLPLKTSRSKWKTNTLICNTEETRSFMFACFFNCVFISEVLLDTVKWIRSPKLSFPKLLRQIRTSLTGTFCVWAPLLQLLSPWRLHSHCGLWPLIWDHHPTASYWR